MAKIENDVLEKLSQQMKKITKFESRAQQRKSNFLAATENTVNFPPHPLIINSSKRQAVEGKEEEKSAGKRAAPRRRGALRAIISRVHPHMNEKLTRFLLM